MSGSVSTCAFLVLVRVVSYFATVLTRYLPRIKVRKEKSLLGAGQEDEEAKEEMKDLVP